MKILKQLTAWIVMIAMLLGMLNINMIDAWAATSIGSFSYGLNLLYENPVEGTEDKLKPGTKIIVDQYWVSDDKKAEFEAAGYSFSYKWQTATYSKYSFPAPNWIDIDGENGSTYTVKESDIGKKFRIVVSVENMDGELMYTTGGVTNIKNVVFDKSSYANGEEMTINIEYYNNMLASSVNNSDTITWEESEDTTNYNWSKMSLGIYEKSTYGYTNGNSKVAYRVTVQEYTGIQHSSPIVFMYGPKKMLSAELVVLNDDGSINRTISDGDTAYPGEMIDVNSITIDGPDGIEVLSKDEMEKLGFFHSWKYYNEYGYDYYQEISYGTGGFDYDTGIYTLQKSQIHYPGISACVIYRDTTSDFTSDYNYNSAPCVYTPYVKVIEKPDETTPRKILSAELTTTSKEVEVGETLVVKNVTVQDTTSGQQEVITTDLENKFNFQWQREDDTGSKTDIPNETQINYTVTEEDKEFKGINAEVTPKTDEYTGSAETPKVVVVDTEIVKYTITSAEMSYSKNNNTGNYEVSIDSIVAENKEKGETVRIPSESVAWNGFTYNFYIGDELIGTPANPMIQISGDKDIGKLKVVITGKDSVSSDGRIYIGEVTLNTEVEEEPVEDNLTVKDTEKPDTPNPPTTKPGNTLVAEFETTESVEEIDPDQIIYTWYIKGEDGADDEEIPDGNGKEVIVPEDTPAGSQVYVVLTYPGKPDFKKVSEYITVEVNTEDSKSNECNVIVTQGQSFTVTIPAFVSLNGDKNKANEAEFYTIVTADISGTDSITVEPAVKSFEMTERGGVKKPLTATIAGDTKGWRYAYDEDDCSEDSLAVGVERTHTISVAKLSAGKWTGTFNWNITTTGRKIADSEEYVKYRTYESKNGELEYIEGSEVKEPEDAKETPWD